MSKIGKEIKLTKFRNYNITIGSLNKNPKAIYINISTWAEPIKNYEINYNRVIKNLNKKIKQELFNYIDSDKDSDFILRNTIVDLDIRESGIRYEKRSFLNCEITLFLNIEIELDSERMTYNIDKLLLLLIRKIFDEEQNFNFHKKKL